MNSRIFTFFFFLFSVSFLSAQTLLDSYSDGDFTASPVWSGDDGAWTVTSSTAAAGASGSNTLRLDVSSGSGTQYLSTQVGTWGDSQEWGFFLGRRSQSFTSSNNTTIWLYGNESDIESSSTIDGYVIQVGDNSGGDEFRLNRVTDGVSNNTIITSSSIPNGTTDFGVLIRVTRSSTGDWELFTSTLPTSNGSGAIATDVPNSTNANVSQGTGNDNTHSISSNGYFGIECTHSSGANGRAAQELDQVYLTTASSCTFPTTQPSNVTFSTVTGTTMDINWTQGDGDGSLVVVREGSAVSASPVNGTTYTANSIFGSGDDIGTNEYVVYRDGAASTVTVTGLSEATTYHVAIFEYNDTGNCYLSPSTATGNQTTTCATPTEVMNPNAAPANTTAIITWNDASCFDEILVVASTASVTGVPLAANSGSYTANAFYPNGSGSPDFGSPEHPVFKAVAGNTVSVTGLTNSTQYFFKIFTRKGSVWSAGVEVNTTPLPVLFIEDFDDNTGAVTTVFSEQCNDNLEDYFGIVCQNGDGCGNEIASAMSFTGGDGGSFLGAHDTDGPPCSSFSQSVTFEDINVSGAGTMYICFEIAEDDDGSSQDWDASSIVSFEVDFDNAGSFGKVIQFASLGATNTEPGMDTNCDGTQDGTALTDAFTTYCVGIDGSGTTMDLRIAIDGLNDGDEDVAIDNIQLYDGSANLPVAASSSTCAAALPIELAFFRGEYLNNAVELVWQTFSETNNDYFEIEHSLDGKEFSAIGMVEGNGTVYSSISYNFPHKNPAVGMNYYRLKQFDFDGNYAYSNVVTIETERIDNEVSIFPNPFSNELTLQFGNENENVQTIQILNLNGQVLFEKTTVFNSSETIDLAHLNNGIYFLRVADDRNAVIRKVEKF